MFFRDAMILESRSPSRKCGNPGNERNPLVIGLAYAFRSCAFSISAVTPAVVNQAFFSIPAVRCATAGCPLRTVQVQDNSANQAIAQLQNSRIGLVLPPRFRHS